MSTDLATTAPTPLTILSAAVASGIDPDKLGRLMELAEGWEKNRAAERFADAVSQFQAECPVIFKSRTAKVKDWQYAFASYDDVMREAAPVLAKCGIALTFSTEPAPGGLKVTCRVRVGTHYEDHALTVPLPQMTVNDTQRFGAALSYAKRYALCAALNIVVTDEDDDAVTQLTNIDEAQRAELERLIGEKNVDMPRFLAWAGVDDLARLPAADFPKALDMLRRKKGGAR